MNDINKMPPKCQYCPYWEVCEYPWVCPDREQLATNLQQTCSATDTISRQMAIDAVSDCGICIQRIVDLPYAQPEHRWIPCSERLPEKTVDVLQQTLLWGHLRWILMYG